MGFASLYTILQNINYYCLQPFFSAYSITLFTQGNKANAGKAKKLAGSYRSKNPTPPPLSPYNPPTMKPKIIHPNPDTEFFFEEGCHILELLNSAEDENLSIARARVEPGETTRLHRLHGITERYIIIEGQGELVLDQSPSRSVVAGDVVVIPPECPQKITNTGSGDLVFFAVCTPRFLLEAYEGIDETSTK